MVLILIKRGSAAFNLDNYFTNSSGHPVLIVVVLRVYHLLRGGQDGATDAGWQRGHAVVQLLRIKGVNG
jgi:hypothetical protein